MNKKFLNVFLFSALCLGTTGTFTSCKDYDDDIKDLQGQITTMQGNVDDLKKKIEGGLVVTSVEKTADGVKITFSNGQTYELKNGAKGDKGDKGDTGATGAAGKDAVVWTIGQDGFWYKDGVKTEYKAIGTDGSSSNGTNGANGANGYYYKPNTETGCFDVYVLDENGQEEFVENTNISYLSPVEGVSVVHDGNMLYINGAEDSEGNPVNRVELTLGKELSSVAFVPELLDYYSKYPLAKFYHVAEFLDENKYDKGTLDPDDKFKFDPQSGFDKSNEVALTYRVNPKRAYVEGAILNFINRSIQQTRAIEGDEKGLINIVGAPEINDEKIIVKTNINVSEREEKSLGNDDAIFDLAALQASVGTDVPVTSDYIAVRSIAVDPILADSVRTIEGQPVVEYDSRTKVINSENPESDAFVKQYVGKVADGTVPEHLKLACMTKDGAVGSIDLSKKVGLYDKNKNANKWLASYNFKGMSYEFSLPKEYKADDTDHTNQQWFVKLNGSVLSINTDNLGNSLIPAIGRRPIVRVDAFLTNNAGEKKLVASSYIRLEIVERETITHNIVLSKTQDIEYHSIDGTTDVVNMGYERVNKEIYSVEGLKSTNFWDNYGKQSKEYILKIVAYEKVTGKEVVLEDNTTQSTSKTYKDYGISITVDLNENAGTTSAIKVGLTPEVLTQNSRGEKDKGKGAQYKVTIKIEANDHTQHGDFVLTQVINVKDECVYYEYNPNYWFDSWNNKKGDYIVVKGKLDATSNTWKMTSQLAEHFKLINDKNIFDYYSNAADPFNYKNVKPGSLNFKCNYSDVTLTGDIKNGDVTLELNDAMSKSEEIKTMNYEYTLTNGETCTTSYNVVFVNPFMSGTTIKEVSLKGNAPTAQTAKTAPSVLVVDKKQDGTEGEAIYEWNNNKLIPRLTLSPRAEEVYKIKESAVKVEYEWVTEDENYKAFTSQLTNPVKQLKLNDKGEITWDNGGATLSKAWSLQVKATVTFEKLSEVEVIIPVTITTEK